MMNALGLFEGVNSLEESLELSQRTKRGYLPTVTLTAMLLPLSSR
jgi:hypothetical protein